MDAKRTTVINAAGVRMLGWKGPTMARVPEPMPDRESPGHYKDVFDTSNKRDTGEARPVDEFAPCANIKKKHKKTVHGE